MPSLVSVVTPVHNTEAYIAECVESVLAQSYPHFEYVILDNRSTDRTVEIVEGYARRDPRIRVERNRQFLAQTENYNQALRLISPDSRYVKIVQADDWLFPRCLECMVEVADAAPKVGIVGALLLRGSSIGAQGLPYPSRAVPGSVPCRLHLLEGRSVFGSPTSLMFRADLVRSRDPFYSEVSPAEDTEVCYDLLQESDFGFVHEVLSYVRVDNPSITAKIQSYGPYLLHELILATKYAATYLTEEEGARVRRRAERRYFRFLGAAVMRRREPGFWRYHREGLATIGRDLTRLRLARHAAGAALDIVLNPKQTVDRWRHGWE